MKRFILFAPLVLAAAPALAAMKPTNLKCEYLTDPLGMDAPRPRFSWILESEQRAQIQAAYQIRVFAQYPKPNTQNLLWDTGKVASNQTASLVYGGPPLESGARYVWKARVWDKSGKAQEASAFFETGLLKPEDWHGKWIARTTDTAPQPAPMLRRAFELKGKVRRARAYVCGLGYYELRINGQKIGDHHLDPGYTRYDRRALYSAYDVTPSLRAGKNAVGVILGNGWYNVHTRAVWYFDKAPWRAAPKLLMEMRIVYEDGRAETIVSDENWKVSTGPILYDSIYGGETYDARLEKPGWDTPDYDDRDWEAAKLVDAPGGKLAAQAMPPIRICETLTPAKITEPKPGVFVFDMGQNFAGHARLSVEGPAGTKIVMRYGERLAPDGTLDQSHIAQHLVKTDPPQQFQTDTYILKGGGKETWEARFCYHGFQYVEVTGFPGKPTRDSLRGLFVHSDVKPVGEFTCSSELLNKIQHNARWSYLSNLMSIPTDCPHREKNGWTGDAHLAAETGLYNFDAAAVYEKWINDLGDEQRPTGELPGIVPSSGWGYEWGNGPAWDSAFLLIPWYLYEYNGDTQALADHYAGMRRYVDYLTSRAKEGIVSIGLGDWVAPETQTPVELTSTAYYYRDALIVSEAARLLGKDDDARKYAELADGIKKSFNVKFFNPKTNLYANGSQTALSCALYQGLCPEENRERVLDNLRRNLRQHSWRLDCGILGTKYLLNALLDNGRADAAYRLITQKEYPGYAWQIARGANTLWESWDGSDSRLHIMFGDVSAWLYKALAGIQPETPGFARIRIQPCVVGDLTSVKAAYDSIRGRIESEWKRESGAFTLTVRVPANATALVCVPADDSASVTEGGKPAQKAEGVAFQGMENGCAVYQVGSGRYVFQVKREK